MSKKTSMKPIALAISAAFASTVAATSIASADTSVFSMTNLTTGYMLDEHAKKGEEGKCGGDKAKGEEGKCGEGKCGEGKCGEKKGEEGKCGEGKCGGDKAKGEEGKCGGDKAKDKGEEGKCGGHG